MRLLHLLFIAIAAFAFIGIAQAEDTAKIISPNSLQWKDVPNYPGLKMAILMGNPDRSGPFVVRIKMPANYVFGPHTHPINEMDTVLSGTLYFGNGTELNKQQSTALKPGSFIMIPADAPHYTWTKQETVIQIVGRGPWGSTQINQ